MHIQWTGSLRGLLAALVALFLLGCEEAADAGKTAEAPAEVGVIVARPAPIGITSELPGRLEAYRQAEVRARVAGIVTRRLYEEGQDVRAGTVLFQIDPAPLKAALARAEASHAAAADKLKRYADLIKDRAISEREYTEAQTDARQALAQIASAKAELEQARLRLGYATVTAPIDGRARRALVGEDSPTPLTRVEQIDPIYVNFSQPAGEVAAMQRAIREGQVKGVADKDIAVRLVLADGSEYPLAGELLFSDLAVDPGTDTIAMRALFRNPHRELLPGGYVQVRLQRAVNPQAITVPRDALIRTAQSAVVKVVNPQGVVEDVEVRADTLQGRDWIISRGLKGGERVIVENAAQHAAGSSVQAVVRQPASADAPSPLAASPAGQ
ncbi:multidrug efflux RND transporter periplasmic adaptor subunit MexX [Pseudomonas aeruginosa]|nr:multidrug efflux RND transporter periplasmic adaptor subunit MexX [Pseudomonas aeruginosa]